jgi:hypothetical protein
MSAARAIWANQEPTVADESNEGAEGVIDPKDTPVESAEPTASEGGRGEILFNGSPASGQPNGLDLLGSRDVGDPGCPLRTFPDPCRQAGRGRKRTFNILTRSLMLH